MDWHQFLKEFERAVEAFRARPDSPAPVVERKTVGEGAGPAIWIGAGSWDQIPEADVCLNNKGASHVVERERPFGSITELVEEWPASLVSRWKKAIGEKSDPTSILTNFRLVVEDASPDSCFGLIFFCARLYGLQLSEVPENWRSYTKRWEAGDVLSTGLPEQSFGALHSALYHSYLEDGWRSTWAEALAFMLETLQRDIEPEAVDVSRPWQRLVKVKSLVEFERQAYEDSLNYATTVQLLLPIRGSGSTTRARLIDAYLVEEHVPLGLLKNFVRTDSVNPSMKAGFTLMAIHKPHSPDDGDYLAVSLTPGKGLHLLDLWRELEAREDQAYAVLAEQTENPVHRANDNPRSNMIVYKNGLRGDGVTPAPNNPWFLDYSMTLVAAPHGSDTKPGTLLSWEDVLDAVWACYQPFRNLYVVTESGKKCRMDQCSPVITGRVGPSGQNKKLLFARWLERNPKGDGENPNAFVRFSPTLYRFLAACVRCAGEQEVSIRDLPQAGNFDVIEFNGGFGVVCDDGAYVIDDWRRDELAADDVKQEFAHVSARREVIDRVAQDVKDLYENVEKSLSGGLDGKTSTELLNQIASMKIDVGKKWSETSVASFDPGVIAFRQALERRFGIEGKLEEFYASIDRISAMLNSYIELKTNARVAWLTIYGFPIVLFASFFGFVFNEVPACPGRLSDLPLGLCGLLNKAGLNLMGLILFLMLSALGTIVLRNWSRRQEKTSRLKKKLASDDQYP